MKEIAESDLFHTFLRSGVQSLKEAHVVSNPQKTKRRSFLEIVKTPAAEEAQKAEVRVTVYKVHEGLEGLFFTTIPKPRGMYGTINNKV